MKAINEKIYNNFTPSERLNLAIAALAREDQVEVDRLQRSCPVKNYTARDLKYKDYFISYTNISMTFYTLCADLFTRITAYSYVLLLNAQKLENKKLFKLNIEIKSASDSQDILIAQLKAVYDGFYQFCNDAKLNGDDILKTINFGVLNPDGYLSMEYIKADEEYTKEVKALFMELWQH